jgi:hypothetical protein
MNNLTKKKNRNLVFEASSGAYVSRDFDADESGLVRLVREMLNLPRYTSMF